MGRRGPSNVPMSLVGNGREGSALEGSFCRLDAQVDRTEELVVRIKGRICSPESKESQHGSPLSQCDPSKIQGNIDNASDRLLRINELLEAIDITLRDHLGDLTII